MASQLHTLHPDIRPFAAELVRLAREVGWPVYVSSGARTQAQQDYLYAQGRTRPGRIVTWTRNSKHIGGYAFDLDFEGWGRDSVPAFVWRELGRVWIEAGGNWGGAYGDYAHFDAL